MTILEATILGVVQGLTEFLPVSSSGHLVLAGSLLGVHLPGVFFEVSVHVATLCAVLWVYRERVLGLASGLVQGDSAAVRYVLLLALASVPAALAGLLARDFLEATFEEPTVAAAFLLLTGALVWSLKRTAPGAGDEEPDTGQALWAGVAQALALFPGVSRSGATVAAGVWRGVDAVRMAEFSFLMSVPAIAGAAFLQIETLSAGGTGGVGSLPLAAGFVTALVSGVAAIHLFVRMLQARSFHLFGYYCWTVGGAYLLAALLVPGLRG